MIILSKTLLSKIESHGETTYPEECCGAVLGSFDANKNEKVVSEVIEIDNISTEDKKRRFMIKAEEYQRVEKYAKDNSLTLLGFYHSHPDHPPKPSETDLKFSWPFFSYFITSVHNGTADKTFSYILDLDKSEMVDEKLKIL